MNGILNKLACYCVITESTVLARLQLTRNLNVSTQKYDTKKPQTTEDADIETPDPHVPSSKLLSALAGLKVHKTRSFNLGSKPNLADVSVGNEEMETENNPRRRKAALDEKLAKAARVVADLFPAKETIESDLLRQLRRHDETGSALGQQGQHETVSSILSEIKVEQQTTLQREKDRYVSHDERALAGIFGSSFRASPNPKRTERQRVEQPSVKHGRTLFDRQRLGIFKPRSEEDKADVSCPPLVDKEDARRAKMLAYSTIRNGFEEMIQWTEEGKMWKYPIDNEQGLQEEQAVPFHQHIFFDDLLDDLPDIKALRDFMELVGVGLSQNPHLTVRQKHEHINWFKEYFRGKAGVVEEAVRAEAARVEIL